jgi:esterase/lipase
MPNDGDIPSFGKTVNFDEFTVAEIQAVMNAVDMISLALNLTNSEEDFKVKVQISTIVFECAENGERDLKSLVADAFERLTRPA